MLLWGSRETSLALLPSEACICATLCYPDLKGGLSRTPSSSERSPNLCTAFLRFKQWSVRVVEKPRFSEDFMPRPRFSSGSLLDPEASGKELTRLGSGKSDGERKKQGRRGKNRKPHGTGQCFGYPVHSGTETQRWTGGRRSRNFGRRALRNDAPSRPRPWHEEDEGIQPASSSLFPFLIGRSSPRGVGLPSFWLAPPRWLPVYRRVTRVSSVERPWF